MEQISSYWEKRPATEINQAIAELPEAELHRVQDAKTGKMIKNRYVTVVDGKHVDFPSDQYVLKQHSETFRPVVEAITLRGIEDFEFSLWSTLTRATLAVYVGEATDGVNFGFQVTNSVNRSTSIRYSLKAYKQTSRVKMVEKEHVLVWGYRQTCDNGMVVKVPLKSCKYMDAVRVKKIKELLDINTRIIHKGENVDSQLEKVQYLVEGFLLLKDPLNMMIIDAQKYELTRDEAEKFLEKYIGRRRMDRYLELYGREEQTLWGLYNSITFLASHQDNLSTNVREKLLVRAGDMLTNELMINNR